MIRWPLLRYAVAGALLISGAARASTVLTFETVPSGDVVIFTSYAGEEVPFDREKRTLLMREDDILAVLG